jgi:septal ring factor EnvC (AmiA/AmiB activator)
MIGRKLILLKNGEAHEIKEFNVNIPDLEDIKDIAHKNVRKYGYMALVESIRFSVKFSDMAKRKSEEIIEKTKKVLNRNKEMMPTKPQEVSKFLKMISDYKHKIKKIKHQIKEEEGIK